MTKKLTITVSDEVYDGLHRRIGRRRISRFIDDLARPHVAPGPTDPRFWLTASTKDLSRAYGELAAAEAARGSSDDDACLDGLAGDALDANGADDQR